MYYWKTANNTVILIYNEFDLISNLIKVFLMPWFKMEKYKNLISLIKRR